MTPHSFPCARNVYDFRMGILHYIVYTCPQNIHIWSRALEMLPSNVAVLGLSIEVCVQLKRSHDVSPHAVAQDCSNHVRPIRAVHVGAVVAARPDFGFLTLLSWRHSCRCNDGYLGTQAYFAVGSPASWPFRRRAGSFCS